MQIIYAPNGMDEEIEEQLKKLTGCSVLLQNQCEELNGHYVRGKYADAVEAAREIDTLNQNMDKKTYGFCLDVGVCNLCGQNMYEYIVALGNRIKAVLIRENDGNRESAMLPFFYAPQGRSQTDWLNLFRGLRKIDFDGVLILDYKSSTSAFSKHLRPLLDELACGIGEYFKWQLEQEKVLRKYKQRVLFGAGNMCRNYMKCYGEEFPPLFTCDNNKKLWGTSFEGLEVKNPEELRKIPQDCVIFICNVYYKEIEEQLREMGIQNKIEYFSDEYMPSFYVDRLDVEGR